MCRQIAHAAIGIPVFAGEYDSAIGPRTALPYGFQECVKRLVKPVAVPAAGINHGRIDQLDRKDQPVMVANLSRIVKFPYNVPW